MSRCISSHGEYSDHAPVDDEYTCALCGVEDTDSMRVDIATLTDQLDALQAEANTLRSFMSSLTSIAKSVTTALINHGIITEEQIVAEVLAGTKPVGGQDD